MELIKEIRHTEALVETLEGNALMDVLVRLGELKQRYEYVVLGYLLDGRRIFKSSNLKQEGYVSKSAKAKDMYQFTFFDKKGAVGDVLANDFETLAGKINDIGFQICHRDELEILY